MKERPIGYRLNNVLGRWRIELIFAKRHPWHVAIPNNETLQATLFRVLNAEY